MLSAMEMTMMIASTMPNPTISSEAKQRVSISGVIPFVAPKAVLYEPTRQLLPFFSSATMDMTSVVMNTTIVTPEMA